MAKFDWSKYQVVDDPNSGNTQKAAPAKPFDWSKYQVVSQPPPSSNPLSLKSLAEAGGSLLGDVGTGIAKGMYSLGSLIPGFTKVVPEPEPINQAVGLPTNTLDKGVQDVSQFAAGAPFGEAAGAAGAARFLPAAGDEAIRVGKLLGGNVVGGASGSNNNPIEGGLLGGIAGGTVAGAMPLIGKGMKSLYKTVLGTAAQNQLAKNVATSIANRTNNAAGLGNALKSGYANAMADFNANQGAAEAGANNLDKQLATSGSTFDSRPYENVLKNFVDEYNNATPVRKGALQDAHDFAQSEIDKGIIPQNFNDLMQQNRNLNQSADNFFTARYGAQKGADKHTTNLIKQLKQGIQDTFDANAAASNLPADQVNNVKNSFNNANAAYGRAQNMGMLPDTRGNAVPDKGLMAALKSGQDLQDNVERTLSNSYLNRGSAGFNLLKKQIGDQSARDALASQVFKNAGAEPGSLDGLKVRTLVNQYDKLPANLKNRVFNSNEKEVLDALNSTDAKSKYVGGKSWMDRIPSYLNLTTGSALAGGYTGYKKGGLPGAVAGGALGMLGGRKLTSLLESPKFLKALYKEAPIVSRSKKAPYAAAFLGSQLAGGSQNG